MSKLGEKYAPERNLVKHRLIRILNNYWMRRSRRLRLITLAETLIILDTTKTESNNCLIN